MAKEITETKKDNSVPSKSAPQSFWIEALKNPEGTKALIEDGIKALAESYFNAQDKLVEKQLNYSAIRIVLVVLLLAAMIYAASNLVSMGRVDSSSFMFFLGTITGYLLTFLAKVDAPIDKK